MAAPSVEALTDPQFVVEVGELVLAEVRRRRGQCQDAEETLSFRRRLVQGRLDIVQAELFRRAGGQIDGAPDLVQSLPDILVEHGDRHLGPGRLTSLGADTADLGADFDDFAARLDGIVDGARLSELDQESEESLRRAADELDELERGISAQRHRLHAHIDRFQEEIVRRYKSGEASVDSLLEQ